jgi:hypothetical protein
MEEEKFDAIEKFEPVEYGIMLVHLVSGETLVADVFMSTVDNAVMYCRRPLLLSPSAADTGYKTLLTFQSFVPMFTGEAVAINQDKIIYVANPNDLLVRLYNEFVVDIINKNSAVIAAYEKTLNDTKESQKKTIH